MLRPKLLDTLKNYNRKLLTNDVLAGLTVGIVALPLAMAFAIASGTTPERGLFTAIVAGLIISAFGGSKVQIGGPTGAFVVLVSSILAQHGYNALVITMLLAGVFLIIFGLSKMGSLIKFIPFPVTTGFTTGIAVVIFSTQIKDLLGLDMATVPAEIPAKWAAYFKHIASANPHAIITSATTIAVIAAVRKYAPKLPSMLIGMIAGTLLASLAGLDVQTIGSRFGQLPHTLPVPALPTGIDLGSIRQLIMPAFTVAILAAIESLLSATVADGMTAGRHRSNMELIAQGLANIGSGFFGGIPATGAIARTATNIKSGARTPVAGIVHAITLFLILFFLSPLAKAIPLASLAGILVVVSYNMSEMDHFVSLFKAPKSDTAVLLMTFALTVLVDLTVAVEVGLMLAAMLFIKRMSEISNVSVITDALTDDDPESTPDEYSVANKILPPDVEVFEIHGPFFFGAADKFQEVIRTLDKPVRVIILRIRSVPAIDATGLHALRNFVLSCQKTSTTLILSGVHTQPAAALKKCGLAKQLGSQNITNDINAALKRAQQVLENSTTH